MEKNNIDWQTALADSPNRQRGYSQEIRKKVLDKIQNQKSFPKFKLPLVTSGLISAAVIVLIFFFVPFQAFWGSNHSGNSIIVPQELTWNDHIYAVSSRTIKQVENKLGQVKSGAFDSSLTIYRISNVDPARAVAIEKGNGEYAVANITTFLTLQQAQAQTPFKIMTPSNLPHNMTYQNVLLNTDPNTGKVNEVNLTFASPDNQYSLVVTEHEGLMGQIKNVTVKEITVNGQKAQYSSDDKITSISWTNAKISLYAYTNPKADFATEQGLSEIAQSFK